MLLINAEGTIRAGAHIRREIATSEDRCVAPDRKAMVGAALLGRHQALQFFSAFQQDIGSGRCRILLRALLHHQKRRPSGRHNAPETSVRPGFVVEPGLS